MLILSLAFFFGALFFVSFFIASKFTNDDNSTYIGDGGRGNIITVIGSILSPRTKRQQKLEDLKLKAQLQLDKDDESNSD